MADDRLKKHLHRQIEFICDTEEGTVHDVVVRMATDSKEDDALVSSVAQTVRRRALLISARDVLPVSRDVLEASRPKRGARASSKQQLRGEPHSLLAQVASSAPPGSREIALDEIREESRRALAPLLKAGVVREATTALAAMPARRRPPPLDPVGFWTSGSAVLQIREEDMHNLIEFVPGIEDMLPNRRLLVPPVAVPKQHSQPVEDSKAGTWGIRKIGALSVWGAYGKRGEGSLVGLLDTGVDATHPDLKGKIAQWAEFDAKGKKVKNSTPHDSHQHGTHCAGTIAGGNASGRWIGVAPAAKIAAALVLNGEQGGTDAQVLAGIDWAVETKVDVISMSLGGFVLGPDTPSTYTKAIVSALRLGIPLVAAIGNEGSQTTGSPGNDLLAFAIGATDPNDRAAGFSGGRTQIIQEFLLLLRRHPAAHLFETRRVGAGRRRVLFDPARRLGAFQRHVHGNAARRRGDRASFECHQRQDRRCRGARLSHSGSPDGIGGRTRRIRTEPPLRLRPHRCAARHRLCARERVWPLGASA